MPWCKDLSRCSGVQQDPPFLRTVTTMSDSWVYQYDPELKKLIQVKLEVRPFLRCDLHIAEYGILFTCSNRVS